MHVNDSFIFALIIIIHSFQRLSLNCSLNEISFSHSSLIFSHGQSHTVQKTVKSSFFQIYYSSTKDAIILPVGGMLE